MQGRAKDQSEMRARGREFEPELRKLRPDLIGGLIAWHGDGTFTEVGYFTSEADARRNEQAMAESHGAPEFMDFIDGEMTFFDLTSPLFD
jgi:hypothetical protein